MPNLVSLTCPPPPTQSLDIEENSNGDISDSRISGQIPYKQKL